MLGNPEFTLGNYLRQRIPGARLEPLQLPQVPEISLYLINEDYPRDGLNAEQADALMDNPPYWAFCWASGQVLARQILDNPHWVKNKTVIDFGAGSGVVGIAAKMAGAARVLLCDLDQQALDVALLNADLNAVALEYYDDFDACLQNQGLATDVITVADVFYDRDNLPLLKDFNQRFDLVLVSDSRLRGQALPGLTMVSSHNSHTVPDLDESVSFNRVTLYQRTAVNRQ